MIANINYKGVVTDNLDKFQFNRIGKPKQYIYRDLNFTILIFKTGNCRIMGCRKPLTDFTKLPFGIEIKSLQSMTVTYNFNQSIHLFKLVDLLGSDCSYEPELFPALRYLSYNPLCVNIFHTGKMTILGIRTLDYKEILDKIVGDIEVFLLLI